MRRKYLDESKEFSPWFIHGERADTVDVNDHFGLVLVDMSREAANAIIAARNVFLATAWEQIEKQGTYPFPPQAMQPP